MPDKHQLGGEGPRAVQDALTASLLDSLPVGIAVYDDEGRLTGYNATWLRLVERDTDVPVERIQLGVKMYELVPLDPALYDMVASVLQESRTFSAEGVPFEARNGKTVYYDMVWAPLRTEGVTGVVQVLADATDRVGAYQLLEQRVAERTAELDRRREVADGLHDILAILNSCCPRDQVMDYIIGQAKRLLGSEAVTVYRLGQDSDGISTIASYGISDDLILDIAFPTNEGYVADTLMQRKPLVVPNSSMLFGPITDRMQPEHRERIHRVFTRYRALLAMPLVISDKVWGAVAMYYPGPRAFTAGDLALASDLADHLALALENAELREQAEEAAASAERGRLARDLHDAVTQTLFSASLIAEVLPRLWQRDQDEAVRRVEELRRLTRGALAEMRTLLLELRPAALVDADLCDVLRQLAEAVGTTGPLVTVTVEGVPRRLPPDQQIALYRIVQEALNNVAKHGQATRADVVLRFMPRRVELEVADDGCGFDAASVGGDHHGLRIMRERAEACGGFLQLESVPGKGTRICVMCDHEEEECSCSPSAS